MMRKMLLALVLLCPAMALANVECADESECPDGTTCCFAYTHYICCLDGYTCNSFFGMCIPDGNIKSLVYRSSVFSKTPAMHSLIPRNVNGIPKTYNKESEEHHAMMAPLRFEEKDVICSNGTHCPDGTTCCNSFVGYICCPKGTTCDSTIQFCMPDDKIKLKRYLSSIFLKKPAMDILSARNENSGPRKYNKKSHGFQNPMLPSKVAEKDVVCTDGTHCSDGTTCCNSLVGYICCPKGTKCDSTFQFCMPDGKMNFEKYLSSMLSKKLAMDSLKSSNGNDLSNKFSKESYGLKNRMLNLKVAKRNVMCIDGIHCPDGSTCCSTLDGVYNCCPLGTPCNSNSGMCMPVNPIRKADSMQYPSKKDTTCPNGNSCSDQMTCCDNGCCPLPSAVCCTDGINCCPSGDECDLAEQKCVSANGNSTNTLFNSLP